jgi:hypothetical protein
VKVKVSGELADLDLFLGETEIPLPDQGNEAELVLEIKAPGKQKLTVAGLKGAGPGLFSLEVLGDAAKAELLQVKEF